MCGSIGSQVKSRQHEGAIRIAPVVGSGRMAIDYDAPSSLLVIPLLTDPRTRGVPIGLAYWSTRSIQDAEDLVSDAAVRTLDAEDRPWKPEERTFLMHMALLISTCSADWPRRRTRDSASLPGWSSSSAWSKISPGRNKPTI
jgi:hypothetical protein